MIKIYVAHIQCKGKQQTQHSNHRDGDREHSKSFYDEPSPLPTEGKKERNKNQKNTMQTQT